MDRTENLIFPNETKIKLATKIQAIYKGKKARELKKTLDFKNRIQAGQKYEELEIIKQEIDKKIDNRFKPSLIRLANEKQEKLNQDFLQKVILGVSIPVVILVIFTLVSWYWQFKWWVKLEKWWNKPLVKWAVEEEE